PESRRLQPAPETPASRGTDTTPASPSGWADVYLHRPERGCPRRQRTPRYDHQRSLPEADPHRALERAAAGAAFRAAGSLIAPSAGEPPRPVALCVAHEKF